MRDLEASTQAWAPGRANYRAQFELAGTEALRRTFIGLGSLARGELADERMEVALATQDQEDEQSCFSDNTHNDIIADALGLQNVWLGRSQCMDGKLMTGPSLRDLVAVRDAAAADQTTRLLAEALATAHALHSPFDQEILGADDAPGRQRVQAVISALKQATDSLVRSASALGIKRLTLIDPKAR
jgi:putative iron-regulated protein